MLRKFTITIMVLSGVFLFIAWLDHFGCLSVLWDNMFPSTTIDRVPSAKELYQEEISKRIEQSKLGIQKIEQEMDNCRSKQQQLTEQITEILESHVISTEQGVELLIDNPVINVLVRSIDQEMKHKQQIESKLEAAQRLLTNLNARKVASDSNISVIEDIGPGDVIEVQQSEAPNTQKKYAEILSQIYNKSKRELNKGY